MKKLFVFLVLVLFFVACSPSQVALNENYNQCGADNCKYGPNLHSHITLDQILW
jgi:hypothetical protein